MLALFYKKLKGMKLVAGILINYFVLSFITVLDYGVRVEILIKKETAFF